MSGCIIASNQASKEVQARFHTFDGIFRNYFNEIAKKLKVWPKL